MNCFNKNLNDKQPHSPQSDSKDASTLRPGRGINSGFIPYKFGFCNSTISLILQLEIFALNEHTQYSRASEHIDLVPELRAGTIDHAVLVRVVNATHSIDRRESAVLIVASVNQHLKNDVHNTRRAIYTIDERHQANCVLEGIRSIGDIAVDSVTSNLYFTITGM